MYNSLKGKRFFLFMGNYFLPVHKAPSKKGFTLKEKNWLPGISHIRKELASEKNLHPGQKILLIQSRHQLIREANIFPTRLDPFKWVFFPPNSFYYEQETSISKGMIISLACVSILFMLAAPFLGSLRYAPMSRLVWTCTASTYQKIYLF